MPIAKSESWSWWAWKAFVGALAIVGGMKGVEAQPQTLYKVTGGANLPLALPSVCNISSAFTSPYTWDVSFMSPTQAPIVMEVGANSAYFQANAQQPNEWGILHNGGSASYPQPILLDCSQGGYDNTCDPLPALIALDYESSLCAPINTSSSISCLIFKAVDQDRNDAPQVRIYAKGFVPNNASFPLDKTIDLTPGVPFNFTYSTDSTAEAEIIAISNEDTIFAQNSAVFLSCSQKPKNPNIMLTP